MQIDRYTRLVPVRDLHRSVREGELDEDSKARRMVLSIPRVKWLERDPDYVPPGDIVFAGGFSDYPPPKVKPDSWRHVPPTKREAEVYRLRVEEKWGYQDIANHLRISADGARAMFSRALYKHQTAQEKKNELA